MTTDPGIEGQAYKAAKRARRRTHTPQTGGRCLQDRQVLFETIERHALEKDGWKRSLSATLALLKNSYRMIEKAECVMAIQEERIAHLEQIATTDELTGIKNRRGLYEEFRREIDTCNRGHYEGGLLLLIDLDNFKAINDTHGHPAGDEALRLVARTLTAEIRAMDVAARLGGDEFVLLLSHTTKHDAAARAQDLGWKLNNLVLTWHGEDIPIRASLGMQAYKGGDTIESVFKAADLGLYTQKEERREREALPHTAITNVWEDQHLNA